MINVDIQEGTVLGALFAVVAAPAAWKILGGYIAFLRAMSGAPQGPSVLVGSVAAAVFGWLGWETGHALTRT